MRGFFIKLSIGIVGLVILVKFGSIDLAVLLKAMDRPGLLIVAFACIVATVPISALRWWMLLGGLNFTLTLRWCLNATFVSTFCNTFLPGAYGGDLVRLAMAYRSAGDGLHRLTFSVITDRVAGLSALLALGAVLIPFLPPAYAVRLETVAAAAAIAGLLGVGLMLCAGDLLVRLVGRLPAPIGPVVGRIVGELVEALHAYVKRPSLLCAAFVTSVLQWVLVLFALVILGRTLQFHGLPWSGYAIAGIWSLIANALPITPGGIGVGEATFAHAALVLSVSSAEASGFGTVFLAMRMLTIAAGLFALLPWLLQRAEIRTDISTVKAEEASGRRVLPVPE